MSLIESFACRGKLEHVVMFHSSTLHSGLFSVPKNKNRRLSSRCLKCIRPVKCSSSTITSTRFHIRCEQQDWELGELKFINDMLYFNAAWGYGHNPRSPIKVTHWCHRKQTHSESLPRWPGRPERQLFVKTNNVENDAQWDHVRSEVFLRNYVLVMMWLLIFNCRK